MRDRQDETPFVADEIDRAPVSTTRHRWRRLEAEGAKTQRLLWASTGTKNPAYSDVLYVESLVAPETIATIPPQTLRLFEDHGVTMRRLGGGVLEGLPGGLV